MTDESNDVIRKKVELEIEMEVGFEDDDPQQPVVSPLETIRFFDHIADKIEEVGRRDDESHAVYAAENIRQCCRAYAQMIQHAVMHEFERRGETIPSDVLEIQRVLDEISRLESLVWSEPEDDDDTPTG